MLLRFVCGYGLIALLCACGTPGNEVAAGDGVEVGGQNSDMAEEECAYHLVLDEVADVMVGEKFYITAVVNDCAGRVLQGEAASAEVGLSIKEGDEEYRQLALVQAREGLARFYVLMHRAGDGFVLQAETKIEGDAVIASSAPFRAMSSEVEALDSHAEVN